MMNTLASDPVYNLAGRTTIAEYTALLARCAFFIGCDSAGVHLAAAVQTPTATLYGPTSPDAWAPREAGHIVIRNDMDCVPCRQKGCRNSGSSLCLARLSVDAVVQRITPLLSNLTVS
jgi:heptosyltransferase-3